MITALILIGIVAFYASLVSSGKCDCRYAGRHLARVHNSKCPTHGRPESHVRTARRGRRSTWLR